MSQGFDLNANNLNQKEDFQRPIEFIKEPHVKKNKITLKKLKSQTSTQRNLNSIQNLKFDGMAENTNSSVKLSIKKGASV